MTFIGDYQLIEGQQCVQWLLRQGTREICDRSIAAAGHSRAVRSSSSNHIATKLVRSQLVFLPVVCDLCLTSSQTSHALALSGWTAAAERTIYVQDGPGGPEGREQGQAALMGGHL